jgi:hypothetical protein
MRLLPSPSSARSTAVGLTFAAALATGCATHTGAKSLGLGPNESLAAGRFRVTYNGDDVTSKVYFSLTNADGKSFLIDQDESGFFVARFAPGSYELRSLVFSKMWRGAFGYDLEPGRAVIDVGASGKIYDVGMISIDWAGPGAKMGTYFGLVGAIVDVSRGNGQLAIRVTDDSADLANELARRFGARPAMVSAPLRPGKIAPAAASREP